MTTAAVHVCIAGGGPAGLLLGLLLAKRGVEVLVLEAHQTFDREFRGEVLQPSTAHLLQELGLLEYILAQPHSLLEAGKVRIDGREVGEFSFKRISPAYPYAIWMPQPIFLAALLRKAAPLPTFNCWMGARVSRLLRRSDGTICGVSGVRRGEEPFEIHADVVIGADGRYSTVAKLGDFAPAYEHHDFDLIWFSVDRPATWSSTMYVSLGEDVRGLLLPKYPHHIQAGIALPTGAWRDWRKLGVKFVAERIRRLDPVFAGFADALHDFSPFFPLAGEIRLMKEWARDGVLLIGDAAHTMSPAGAIGVNVALATAAVAAQQIYSHVGNGPIPKTVLNVVQQIREPDVRTLHRMQLGAQRVLLGQQGSGRVTKWLIPKVIPLVLRTPVMPRLQRRIFFGAPLPPLDEGFTFR